MSTSVRSTIQTRYGLLEVRPVQWDQMSPCLRGRRELFHDPHWVVWRPAPTIAAEFRPDYSVTFEVVRDPTDARRFVPRDGHGVLTRYGWMFGLEILRRETGHNDDGFRSTHCKARWVFDRLVKSREHFGRGFRASRDLYVRFSGRGGDIGASLLPDYVGLTADRRGRPWTIRQLTERGREAAIAAGVSDPTNDVAIPYGLTSAAVMNPLLESDPEKIRNLVFAALLDVTSVRVPVTDDVVDDLAERVSIALEEHRDDCLDQFDAWFSGRHSNLVQTLARKAGFNRLDRDVAKSALFQFGRRTYEYVTGCLSVFMRWVEHGCELNDAERLRFRAMYQPQSYYGGLPLLLLLERIDIIRHVVAGLWEQPDDRQLVGALHRLLAIYGELAPARRAADRRFKQLQRILRNSNRTDSNSSLEPSTRDVESSTLEKAASESFREEKKKQLELDRLNLAAIVHRVVRRHSDRCDRCADTTPWTVSVDEAGDEIVRITVVCEEHGFEKEYVLPTREFLDIAREEMDEAVDEEDSPD